MTAQAVLNFINEKLGERPVEAAVCSNPHTNHFGGVRGVIDEADVKSGKVKIIVPIGFMYDEVSENVYAGNAMNQRFFYQYGLLQSRNSFDHVIQFIHKNMTTGNTGFYPVRPKQGLPKT